MTSAIEAYQERVKASMGLTIQAAGAPVVGIGFDFLAILLPVLMPLLIDLLGGCLKPKSTMALADELVNAKTNPWIRIRAMSLVNSTCRDCGEKVSARDRVKLTSALLSGVGTKEDAVAVLSELKAQEWEV